MTKHAITTSGLLKKKPFFACLTLALIIWFSPIPEGITKQGWQLLAIFVATILGLIIKPLPMGAVALISTTCLVLTKTITIQQATHGFTSQVVWLVVMAFFIAQGFVETCLAQRIAYYFTRIFGKRTLGLSYGLMLSDLIMAPAIPSATARSAGIIYPIAKGITDSYDSYPHDPSSRLIGSFLIFTMFQVTVITSTMFMTAMAANPLLASLTADQGLIISWRQWALGAILPGICSLITIPLLIYKVYPPEIKDTPNAPSIAKENLAKMGKMSSKEWIMLCTVIMLIIFWSGGSYFSIKPLTAAMVGLSTLLLTNVLNWKTLTKLHGAWETFFWFSILIMLASLLNEYGVIEWVKNLSLGIFNGVSWKIAFPSLCLVYFYSHYLFASSTAHVSAMYVSFLTLAIALGTPQMLAVFTLCYLSVLFGGITNYSLAPAPLLFAAGYVPIKTWWKLGFICSVTNIIIWSTIGTAWWKILGYW